MWAFERRIVKRVRGSILLAMACAHGILYIDQAILAAVFESCLAKLDPKNLLHPIPHVGFRSPSSWIDVSVIYLHSLLRLQYLLEHTLPATAHRAPLLIQLG